MSGGKIKKHVFREGEVIFEEGGPGDYAYMVMQGEIGIYKNLRSEAPLRLAILYKGDIFGEMALFDARRRQNRTQSRSASRLANRNSTAVSTTPAQSSNQ